MAKINEAEKKALSLIAKGADVYDYGLAVLFRKIEREKPSLLHITDAMSPPEDGARKQPYFGAILTAAGRRACGIK